MTNVTNSDIMQILGRIEEKVDNVTDLAKHTNGTVKDHTMWIAKQEAIEEYKREQNPMPAIQHAESVVMTPITTHWYDNRALVGYVGVAVAAAGAVAGWLVGLTK